jgi:nucleoside-diphosphate-sugar epimerase
MLTPQAQSALAAYRGNGPFDILAERRGTRNDRRQFQRGDRRHRKTIVVTGGAGYIGSLVVRRLLARGYRVRVVDDLLYGDSAISGTLSHPNLRLIVTDFRRHEGLAGALAGADGVLHLGAIVGDPACALDERLTLSTNLEATRLIAGLCQSLGVPRLVFASTCSVYGASDELLDERSALNPVSLYARSKIAAEEALLGNRDDRTAPVVLRFATAYGASFRPRFDLAVNVLTAKAVTEGACEIFGGDQWRPFVHVDDIARALIVALEAPTQAVAGEIFNVGSWEQNHRLIEIGALIQEAIPPARVLTNDRILDRRNYHVRFDKIRERLGFTATHTLRDGIAELATAVSGPLQHWTDPRYDNNASLRRVLAERPALATPPVPLLAGDYWRRLVPPLAAVSGAD